MQTKMNNNNSTKTVFIAGATGYLGRYLVGEYMERGWNVIALVRKPECAPSATRLCVAQATEPETIANTLEGVDLVISSLGITRQRDGMTYRQVDYQANINLLREAERAGVKRFAYIHVLGAEKLSHLPPIAAKQDFVNELRASDIESTVIKPSGFFSDMSDFLEMAKSGRVYLFGDGNHRINPIHGQDLAKATAEAVQDGIDTLEVGGPDVFTHEQLAELAFECLDKPPKITHLWDGFRTLAIAILPWMTPSHVYEPARFFLTAMGMDTVGECHGTHHLSDHFRDTLKQESAQS
jgi:uncharacterized protein YbjT (DUF2867 family)